MKFFVLQEIHLCPAEKMQNTRLQAEGLCAGLTGGFMCLLGDTSSEVAVTSCSLSQMMPQTRKVHVVSSR